MLAHNATINGCPYDHGQLISAGVDDPYVTSLAMISEDVGQTRERQRRQADARANAVN
jgi:hypothetical protein